MIFVCGPIRRNSRSMADFVIETHPAVGEKLVRARCRNTALPRPAMRGRGVVIDLDDEIVEMILARQPVAGLIADQPNRLVVMAVLRVFAPGVFGPDRPGRQKGPRPRMAVGAPPQLPRAEGAPRGAAVALALVGEDAAAAKRHRHGPAVRPSASPGGGRRRRVDADRRERPITRGCLISD